MFVLFAFYFSWPCLNILTLNLSTSFTYDSRVPSNSFPQCLPFYCLHGYLTDFVLFLGLVLIMEVSSKEFPPPHAGKYPIPIAASGWKTRKMNYI